MNRYIDDSFTEKQLQNLKNGIDPYSDEGTLPFEDDPLIEEIANRELLKRQMQQQQQQIRSMDIPMMTNSLDAMTPEEQMLLINK